MEKTYTKKQIAETIAYWEKQLSEAAEESSSTKLHLASVLESLEVYDACGTILHDGQALAPTVKFSADTVQQLHSMAVGKVNAIGVYKVLSREQYEAEIESGLRNSIPYEDYIDDEKYGLQKMFSRDALKKMFRPETVSLVEDVEIDGKKGQAALVAVYSIS